MKSIGGISGIVGGGVIFPYIYIYKDRHRRSRYKVSASPEERA
jgi:hypothetical protein